MDGNIIDLMRFEDEDEFFSEKAKAVEREMNRRANAAIKKIGRYVTDTIAENFAIVLAEAYVEGSSNADTVVRICGLSDDEIKALLGDDDGIFEDLCGQGAMYEPYDEQGYFYG
jgi:hypothetical protein